MMIPGLDYCPTSESELEDIFNIKSFTGTFSFPKSQICGSCRRIAEFEKLTCLKVTSSWVYRKCRDSKNQEIVCIKKAKSLSSSKYYVESLDEIHMLQSLKHHNIMQFYEPVVGDALENTYLVFECCDYFLSDLMDQRIEGLFDRAVIKNIFSQVILALQYIHGKLIMHRDVHPKNLMFKSDGYLKLANFENAREICTENFALEGTSKNYHAPELLLEAPKHDSAIDIWAAGCLLCELFLLEIIFSGSTMEAIFEKIISILGLPNDDMYPGFSSLPGLKNLIIESAHSYNCLELFFNRNSPQTNESISLLKDMFIYYPKVRSTATEILEHPYFTESPAVALVAEVSSILKGEEVMSKMNTLSQAVIKETSKQVYLD